MRPLSGLDAVFLYAETQSAPMHVVATLVVEGRVDHASIVSRLEARLPVLAPRARGGRSSPGPCVGSCRSMRDRS